MRMSVKKNDPGYYKRAGRFYAAFLDGEKVEHCFTADEDKGYVLCHAFDENDNPIVDYAKGGIITKQLFGFVEIRRES